MGTIRGREYSDTDRNEYGDKIYYIDDFDEWMTAAEVQEQNEEENYWFDQADEWGADEDGTGWAD